MSKCECGEEAVCRVGERALCDQCWEGHCDGMADQQQGDYMDYADEAIGPDYWQNDEGEWQCG